MSALVLLGCVLDPERALLASNHWAEVLCSTMGCLLEAPIFLTSSFKRSSSARRATQTAIIRYYGLGVLIPDARQYQKWAPFVCKKHCSTLALLFRLKWPPYIDIPHLKVSSTVRAALSQIRYAKAIGWSGPTGNAMSGVYRCWWSRD